MKKVLFYCQHLLGVGHLTRSLNVCEKLVGQFEVSFVQGGTDIGKTIEHPHFYHHFLLPLVMDEKSGSLTSVKDLPLNEVWKQRQQQLHEIAQNDFHAIIVELYPFGRKAFGSEVKNFIKRLKNKNSKIQVICSLRDILVEKKNWNERQLKIIDVVNEYFDSILVHSDDRYIPLSLTFSRADDIRNKLHYTGFISEGASKPSCQRKRQVLVSIGGGIVGDDLVRGALDAARLLPEVHFVFIKSPNMSESIRRVLTEIKLHNILVIDFSSRYQELLQESQLSISLAGYNTMMNLLATKTFGLIFPYQKSSEQKLRTRIFSEKDIIFNLLPTDLSGERLAQLISENIDRSDWSHLDIHLDGAQYTADWLNQYLTK